MFKPARWWSEKNRVKVDFKLQFHASQVTHVGGDGLMISIVPAESGKPTVKSDKATVRDGSCFWDNPVYETVKFNQDPKSGKIHEKIYYFVIETGLSKSGIVGEASIDLSNYAEANKVSLVSLPIKNSKTEATLHVSTTSSAILIVESIHSVNPEDTGVHGSKDMPLNKIVLSTELHLNANHRASSGSDVTISSSEISSGIEAPWEMQMNNDIIHHEPDGYCTDDSLNTPKVNFLSRDSEEAPDILIEKLKSDNAALSRRAEMCELELQTLRKQIVKESKRGNDFWREIVELKEERDALKGECDYRKALKRRTDVGARMKTNTVLDGVDSQAIIEELKQELNHAKELNSNLQIQLLKTQESNSELILAVQDLDEMLEQKNKEMFDEHSDDKEAYLLEQQIVDLRNEIESYKRDKDELEMQMEQLALDSEIMKQANHEMSNRVEQSQIQEQLKMQYECSSSDTSADELEIRMENVENELKIRSKEYTDSLVAISALEGHAKRLEEELEKQARGFEADLEALTKRSFGGNARKSYEELESIKGDYETRLHQLMNQIEQMQTEIEDKAARLEDQKLLSDEILMLRDEIESHVAKNKILSDEMASKKSLMHEVEQMRMLVKEKELLLEQANDERIELERMVESVKNKRMNRERN
ncbi:hypothetical protein DH2020_036180 [Rehmannia glutinosa]|uniref:C2 NT-type domain-containing protein n=1 Tax=Rehmannia glutinosa TaxID=99300 RepID=A0ABR0V649_REHGL